MPTFLRSFLLWILHNFFDLKLYIIPIKGCQALAFDGNIWYDIVVFHQRRHL